MLIRKLKEWWSILFGPSGIVVGREIKCVIIGNTICDVGPVTTYDPASGHWTESDFFTQHQAKTLRLAEIARERSYLKDRLQKAIAQKKARAPIYQALKALRTEELAIECGRE